MHEITIDMVITMVMPIKYQLWESFESLLYGVHFAKPLHT